MNYLPLEQKQIFDGRNPAVLFDACKGQSPQQEILAPTSIQAVPVGVLAGLFNPGFHCVYKMFIFLN